MNRKNNCVFATIVLKMSKAGIHAICNDIGEDVFCIGGDIKPLIELINKAEIECNPDNDNKIINRTKRDNQ